MSIEAHFITVYPFIPKSAISRKYETKSGIFGYCGFVGKIYDQASVNFPSERKISFEALPPSLNLKPKKANLLVVFT